MSYLSRFNVFSRRLHIIRNVMTRNMSQVTDDLQSRIQKLREDNPDWRKSHDRMCLVAEHIKNTRSPQFFPAKPPFKAAQNPDTTDHDDERRSRMHSVYG